jgi:hypothetical protein
LDRPHGLFLNERYGVGCLILVGADVELTTISPRPC